MGRELRRVPLDFDWPLRKVWHGFLNPHFKHCPEREHGRCSGGSKPSALWLDAIARLIAMIGEEGQCNTPEMRAHMRKAGRIYPHPYLQEWGQAPRQQMPDAVSDRIREIEDQQQRIRAWFDYQQRNPPSLVELDSDIADLVHGLAKGQSLAGGGGSYAIGRTLREVAGVPDDWGRCKVCDGDGMDPAVRDAYENWQPEDPPTGDGWQVWETVSEGSPVSPVFASEAELIEYLVGEGYSRAAAEAFAKAGWVPSCAIVGGEVYDDIEMLHIERA